MTSIIKDLIQAGRIDPSWSIPAEQADNAAKLVKVTGRNTDIDIGTEDLIDAGGDYTFPAAAETLEVVSSSEEDDNTAAAASGTITYGNPVEGVKATGTVTVVNYALATQAIAAGSITYGVPVNDDTVTVGSDTFTKKAAAVAATGTITYGAPGNGDTVEVSGHVFTKVAATPGANQFSSIAELTALITALTDVNATDDATTITITAAATGTDGNAITLSVDGDNTGTMAVSGATLSGGTSLGAAEFATIAGLTALITALAGVNATDNGTTISIVAAAAGAAGNSIALELGVGNAGTMAVSAATLTGGRDHLTITFNGTALVQGTDFTAATSNSATATSIAAAIHAIAGVGAAAVDAVVTITNDARGTAGNSKTLVTNNASAASVSGATLAGGTASDTVVVAGTTFTCVDAAPGANEFSTITQLTALIQALATVNATDDATTITIVAATPGVAGNSITIALGVHAGTMAVSGATLAGGDGETTTGAMTVRITGLDAAYAELVEDVELNGATAAVTTGEFLRVNSVEVIAAGTTGTNVGVLTVTNSTSSDVVAKIPAGIGRTISAVYTIPAAKYGFVRNLHSALITNPTAAVTVQLIARPFGGAMTTYDAIPGQYAGNYSAAPFVFQPKTDIKLRATTPSNNTDIIAGFDLLIVA